MYSNIQDCDEVFNFWEPLHYLDRGQGFQTWETSPEYAIRSYAYIALHLVSVKIPRLLFGDQKRIAFFALRGTLSVVSTLCEAKLYRMVLEKVNWRVARYMLFMMVTSSGMWNASVAFLPSSFAMYFVTLASAFNMEPSSSRNPQRTLLVTVFFATAAIVGWPFALALSAPFVVEELFLCAGDIVPAADKSKWMVNRWLRFARSVAIAALVFVPLVGIDSLAYGKPTVVPWNIIKYNLFSRASGKGPELYGTEPWSYYLANLVLNFNGLLLLAIGSLPALVVTYFVDQKRLGTGKGGSERSSPFTLLAMRLLPLYLWIGILTAQPHKEERFMFPAYPLVCFNAAVTLYLARGWLEVAYIKTTASPYQASKANLFSRFTLSAIIATSLLSISRILALYNYYHAPLQVVHDLEMEVLPKLLNSTGHIHLPSHHPHYEKGEAHAEYNLSHLKDFGLRLCVGKEWHRFPGSYLIPDGIRVDWIKSDFSGLLPGHFEENVPQRSRFWLRDGTKHVPSGMNDMNQEELGHLIDVSACDYLIDLDFPRHPSFSPLEPRYAADPDWERIICAPFLDARNSPGITRIFWLPTESWQQANEYGDYCLLGHKGRLSRKIEEMKLVS